MLVRVLHVVIHVFLNSVFGVYNYINNFIACTCVKAFASRYYRYGINRTKTKTEFKKVYCLLKRHSDIQ